MSFEALESIWTLLVGTVGALRAASTIRGTREARRAGVRVSVRIASYYWVADTFDADVSRRALFISTGGVADAVVAYKPVWT